MKRLIRATVVAALTVGLFGAVSAPSAAHAAVRAPRAACIPGAPVTPVGTPRKCMVDGGSTGDGYRHEEDCEKSADNYSNSNSSHDYQCEDVFGDGRYWVVQS
jgi:hypothetical protein